MKQKHWPAAAQHAVCVGPIANDKLQERMQHLMATLHLPSAKTLACAVADSLVIAADPQARHASLFYWERGRPHALAVVRALDQLNSSPVQHVANELMAHPSDPDLYFDLKAHLLELCTPAMTKATAALFAAAWQAECNSRLGYHVGSQYEAAESCAVLPQTLRALPPGSTHPQGSNAQVLVVVPFRDRDANGPRLRNLLACLLSLRDQTAPHESYRVVVVESDDVPQWREVITPYADQYLFAPKAGLFNKSWAVNVGVTNDGADAELICILDADVLVDRDFIARNLARFTKPGTMGHLTYRDMSSLDDASTAWAIKQRLQCRLPTVNADHLRSFILRRPPGACVWVRLSAFQAVGGMDERFEGWGGEDNDFAYRLDTHTAFDSYNDPLLHMYHPPSAALREDGELLNAHIPGLSWRPGAAIGDVNRFTDSVSCQPSL